MSRSDDQRLEDIFEAASVLASIVARGRVEFDSDLVTRLASERLMEIIGEATRKLSDAFKDSHSEVQWRDIADMRILVAHLYHRVDSDQIWAMAETSVPELVERLSGGNSRF